MNSRWDAELKALYQRVKDGRIDEHEAAREIEALRRRMRDRPGSSGEHLQTELYSHDESYLADHLVFGDRVLLGVTHGSLALDLFFRMFPEASSVQLRQLRFIKPVVVGPERPVEVLLRPGEGRDEVEFEALFRQQGAGSWEAAASGSLSRTEFDPEPVDLGSIKEALTPYDRLAALYPENDAIQLGESFRIIRELYRGADQALARVALSAASIEEPHSYSLHPLIINSAFSMLAALSEEQAAEATFLPFGIKQVQFRKLSPLDACWLRLQLAKDSGEMILFDVDILTEDGQLAARLGGCSVKRVRTATDEPVPTRTAAAVPKATPGGLEQQIEAYLLQKVAEISAGEAGDIEVESNLMDLGLSSLQLVETGTAVGQDTGLELDPTLFFEFPSIAELTRYFADEHGQVFAGLLGRQETREATPAAAPNDASPVETKAATIESPAARSAPKRPARGGDIAVIGMHGVFADADDPEALWEHLRDGKDLIREIPLDHWDYKPWFNPDPEAGDYTYSKWGSFIDGVDCFDAEFFRISPREAEYMDPQVRLFLQSLYACAEDAGVINGLRGSNTGVFAGICFNDYSDKMVEMGLPIDPYTGTGVGAIASNRASFWFDFTGPSFVIDTACSSSLFALHSAVLALRNGECDMAFAGGANLLLSSLHYRYFCAIRALSPTGRCHTFDAAADGYVPGECVASLLLKPLEDAERDGDRIHAVIKGSAALHGGYTSSITAPSVSGEENVILKAWDNAGIDPATLSYIEAHGTGTKLGDPIEISALNKAFRRFTREQDFCSVGSIKANLGHTEGAAGIAGVFKVILQMKHRQIPALANLKEVNPYLKLDASAVYINRGLKPWESPLGPRRAGISSFGFSGAYAHLVMEEYVAPQPAPVDEDAPVAILLSARNRERLQAVIERLADHIQKHDDVRLADIAFTLQTGREPMAERLGFVASSLSELKDMLRKLADGDDVAAVFRGRVKRGGKSASALHLDEDMAPTIQSWLQKRKLPQLLDLWVQGAELDWTALYGQRLPRRVGLPSYPFARERYWLQAPEQAIPRTPDQGPASEQLHPLVHANLSTLERQAYQSVFSGREFFLDDHRVGGRKMLPGAAYLEMARFALGNATGTQTGIQLQHVIWAKPLALESDPLAVDIEVFSQDQGLGFEIRSHSGAEDEVHSRGSALLVAVPESAPLDLAGLRQRISREPYTAERYYQGYRAAGIDYGPGHQGLKQVFVGDGEVLARLALPESVAGEDFVLHPALLDSAIQACAGMALGDAADSSMPLALPFALERLDSIRACEPTGWVWIRESAEQADSDKLRKLDLDLCDDQGRVSVRLRGFSSRVFEARDQAQATVQLCQPGWQLVPEVEPRPASFAERHLLLIGLDDVEPPAVTASERLSSALETAHGRYQAFTTRVFEYLKALLEDKADAEVLLQVCIPLQGEPGLRGLSALLKTARAENPRLVCQLIELDDARDLAKAMQAAGAYPGIAELRYTENTLQALHWRVIPTEPLEQLPWKEKGVYLISGGAGGLGLLFAGAIAARIAEPVIVLAGRSALDEEAQARIEELSNSGARVLYRQADVGDSQQSADLVASIVGEFGALNGVLHTAGVLRDDFILRKSSETFAEVLHPKVAGAVNLDRATGHRDLDFMVLFSSGVAVTGNPGQADYAAANGFLDAYADYRSEQLGRRTLSMNWPLWSEGAMGDDEAVDMAMRQAGMAALQTEDGIQALDQALVLGQPQLLVLSGDPARLLPRLNPQLERTDAEPARSVVADAAQADLGSQAIAYLKGLLAEAMRTTPGRIRADEPLEQYGLDSIMVMSLTARLEEDFGALSKTLFFEYQTIEELAGYFQSAHGQRLGQLLSAEKAEEPAAPPAPEVVQTPTKAPSRKTLKRPPQPLANESGALDVAVIGMAGRYPQAEDLDEYWRNLREGRDCISEVPKDRWDWRDYYSETEGPFGVHSSKWGGFISDVDKFDSLFFNISPREAQFLDPQERLFLQTVWQAMEDAGYRREDLHVASPGLLPGRAGVYAGVMYGEYQLFGAEQSVQGNRMAFSSSLASIANRVSYFFDLHGPSLTLDTMCSSSLMALHLACRDLKEGRTDLGIAGGVNVSIHPNKYLMLSAGQFISRRGHCESFGEGGEGYIPGEGVGVVLLKRLEDARRDGDIIHGVIKGSAVNHGGRTHGYSVPNPTAQQSVILDALKESGVDPRTISYVEAHGTGTKLGDPIEITGLTKAYAGFNTDTGYCRIGSAKSNIGHCESAAGVAGLTKVLLQMRAGEIAPSLHAQVLNPHIDFATTPFVVNQELRTWERPEVDGKTHPRVAGISSFGAGGSNAHCIIEEYRTDQTPEYVSAAPAAILLSAKNADRLAQRVERLRGFLSNSPDVNLHDLAFTLQIGREAMPQRLALIVDSLDELDARLAEVQAGRRVDSLRQGQAQRDDEELVRLLEDPSTDTEIKAALQSRDLPRLLDFWIKGLEVPWRELYGEVTPRRIRLPGYPFARQRCWIRLETDVPAVSAPTPVGQTAQAVTLPKPSGIQLASREAMTEFQPVEKNFETLRLQPPGQVYPDGAAGAASTSPTSSSAEGVFTLDLASRNDARTLARQLGAALKQAAADPRAKVLVLHIGGSLPNNDQALQTWIELDMPRRMLAFELPIIADMAAPGSALGWLVAGCGDLVIREPADRKGIDQAVRFAELRDLLQQPRGQERGLAPLPGQTSHDYATELATLLAGYPRQSLGLLKAHLARDALARVQGWRLPLTPAAASVEAGADPFRHLGTDPVEAPAAFESVALASPAVGMQVRADGVVLLSLQDEAGHNAFSEALVRGLAEAFDKLNGSPAYKVVVLTGHDRYFSSGGTRDSLLAIQQGKAKYSDAPIYELPLRCGIPVIAAMQGHAFGAGWSLGMFCDRVLLAEEGLYSSRFMRYGFTPGFGATLIFPQRFGTDLGREILFSAKDYRGADLRDRGTAMPVLPGSEVLPQALAVAGRWALASRQELQQAKAEAVGPLLAQLDEVVRRELAMHQATFIDNPEVLRRIEADFPSVSASADPTSEASSAPRSFSQDRSIRDWLKQSLAAELSIPPEQVADNTPFIDIGLDSITGVTWVRNINEQYGLDIDATSLYQYSTLDAFIQHVLGQVPQAELIVADSAAPPPASAPLILDRAESGEALEKQVLETLRALLARELEIDPGLLDPQAPFIEVGLDSITGVTWVRGIGEHYGLELDATKVYEYPTLSAFSRYVLEQGRNAGLSLGEPEPPQAQPQPVVEPVAAEPVPVSPIAVQSRQPAAETAIAIVGMAGQFPQADDLEQFWDNILGGVDCISEIPAERWSIDDYFDPQPGKPDKTYCRWMGALQGIAEFDAEFFNISPLEAEWMDPQQRLFLQASWRCIEDAGYAPGALSGSRCGVFVGCTPGDYAELASDGMEVQKMLGGTSSILAARISYLLDLQGPCMAIDTACSSSLVAIANACDSLLLGHSDQALAGGVYAMCGPAMHVMTSQAQMLSADGRCFSFDQRANGFVPAEGVGVLLLKRLQDAEQAGDDIYAVIRGWGVNQDGKTNGITAPNPDSQARLERQVYRDFGIDPNRIGLLEAHGTGTKLGDPIEIAGLKAAFSEFSNREQFCALGSVKSNIGHALMAAGVAGAIKAVQSLVKRKLPPSIHCQQINEHIQLDGSPFYLNNQAQDWQADDGQKRMAAVSSFGLSGTNAHLVIEEYPGSEIPAAAASRPLLFVLSARDEERLREAARNLLAYLQDHPAVPLADLAFTLQTGRDEMAQRFATVASDPVDLMQNLQAFTDGGQGAYHDGRSGDRSLSFGAEAEAEDRDYLDQLLRKGRLEPLAELWVSGVGLPWKSLWNGAAPARRHGLPVYPFARERHWLPAGGENAAPLLPEPSEDAAATLILAPVWNPLRRDEALMSEPPQGRLLLIGGSRAQRDALGAVHGDCAEIDIDAERSIEQWARLLDEQGPLQQLLWIAPEPPTSLDGEAILAAQSKGLFCLLRVFKALLQLDYRNRSLDWSIVTQQSQPVDAADAVLPAHAGIHGFVGSLAKEYPAWRIRLLDLPRDGDWPIDELLRLPFDQQGNALAWRAGQWFRQSLIPVDSLAETGRVYRKNGVYLVIGGAGGLGETWSRWMIENYQARIIWVGRRAEDDAIRAKRDALAELGQRPDYRQADATQLSSLQALFQELKQDYAQINGLLHSAVGEFDDNLASMEEQRLRGILAVKLDAVVHLAEVCAGEDLDFALFFSSVASFGKAGGMAGYSAGSCFEDAFARAWELTRGIRCRVVNWGYWQLGTGNSISDASRTRLGQSGMGTLDYEAGMSALQKLMHGDLPQAAVYQASDRDALASGERLDLYPPGAPSCIDAAWRHLADAPPSSEQMAQVASSIDDGMKESLHDMLGSILSSMNLLDEASELKPNSRRPAYYQRWLKHSRGFLDHKQDFASLEAQWAQWDRDKQRWLQDPHKRAVAVLAETCMRALPDILNGERLASEVMFPDSSLKLVEGIYQGNPVSDFFNQALADSLIAVIEERLRQAPSTPIRILEIGAGTGGSTSAVLPRLRAYGEQIAEYAYTDISKAFLFHAQERFAAGAPYLRTQLFDVSQDPTAQSMPLDHYDLAFATNVLHATRDIRLTLRNAKAVLRRNGVLVLNEMAENSLFGHLSFGLLEGWWLNEDQELRLPGAPGLSPSMWQRLLQAEGWRSVCFPAEPAHALGQQIVLAESDGMVRHKQEAAPIQAPVVEPANGAVANETPPDIDSTRLKERARARVGKLLAGALRMSSGTIDPGRPFEQYGIDSILVVQITHKLEEVFGQIDSTLLFEVQNLDGLVDHLIDRHRQTLVDWLGLTASEAPAPKDRPRPSAASPAQAPAQRQTLVDADEPIAIIGISGRYPMARDLDAFWDNLRSGRDCISEVPADRWPLRGFYNPDPTDAAQKGQSYCKSGGFLDAWDEFDARFFNILPVEAMNMDPQERLFLQTAWEVLEDGGYNRELLQQRCTGNVGVFAGITKAGYNLFGPALWQQGESLFPGTSFSSVANRISYFMDLRGPSMAIDTMCSSSLSAIHEACENLRRGSCEMAIAGGVNLYVHPSSFVQLCRTQMLSPDERCKSFGIGANGFVPGEGVGAVLLKPLSLAERDGDRIHALIRATGASHGGKTNGYTVPSPSAQGRLIRETLQRAGIDARQLSYIEAHGTGTELGDPIEVAGLSQAFRVDTEDTGYCALGSVKSNFGHLEAAAGIAGLTKIVLQLQHGQLAPSLHAETLNPKIPFQQSPFRLQRQLSDWRRPQLPLNGGQREGARIAGVSSFGAGGSNVHAIIEEYRRETPQPEPASEPALIVLSARNPDRLQAAVERLAAHIRKHEPESLQRLAYTLQIGREAMQERVGFIVDSMPDLLHKLDEYLQDPDLPDQACHGRVESGRKLDAFSEDEHLARAVEAWMQDRNLYRLLEHWVQGLAIDWTRLYADPAPLPISLPSYPFEPQSYRLPDVADAGSTATASQGIKPIAQAKRHMFRPVWKAKPVAEVGGE